MFLKSIKRRAAQDAAANVNLSDAHLTERHGLERSLDPLNDPRHAPYQDVLARRHEVDELRGDVERGEDEITNHTNPWLLRLAVVFCVAVEALGLSVLLSDLGIANPARTFIAIGTSLLTTFLTWVIVKHSQKQSATPDLPPKRSKLFFFLLVIYGLLAGSLVVVRTYALGLEESTLLVDVATGVVLVASTLGGSWMAESLLRRLAEIAPLVKARRVLRRRLSRREKEIRIAERYMAQLTDEVDGWHDKTARDEAAYRAVFELRRAEEAKREGRPQLPTSETREPIPSASIDPPFAPPRTTIEIVPERPTSTATRTGPRVRRPQQLPK